MSRAAVVCIVWIACIGAIACSGRSEPPRAGSAELSAPVAPAATLRPIETAPVPVSGSAEVDGAARAPARPAARGRPIEIILRSSPPGATAAVDGVPVGPTPTYWAGEANGHEHEFTFVLTGYAFARYRFVPITSGVVHARLEVLAEESDAGVPPELLRAPDAAAVPDTAGSAALDAGMPAP